MKNVAWYGGAIALALLFTFAGGLIGGTSLSAVASAQEATVVPTVGTQQPPLQPTQPVQDNNGFPWGLLGLLGLIGLTGLSRRPEPVRHEPVKTPSTVGVYENKS